MFSISALVSTCPYATAALRASSRAIEWLMSSIADVVFSRAELRGLAAGQYSRVHRVRLALRDAVGRPLLSESVRKPMFCSSGIMASATTLSAGREVYRVGEEWLL